MNIARNVRSVIGADTEIQIADAMNLELGLILPSHPPRSLDTFTFQDPAIFRECHHTVSTLRVHTGVGDQDMALDFHMI